MQKEFVFGMGYKYETLNRTFFDSKPKQNSPFIYFQYDFYPTEKINLIFGEDLINLKNTNLNLAQNFQVFLK